MASDFLIHSITLRANFLNNPFDVLDVSGLVTLVDVKVVVVVGIVALLSMSINVDANGF